MALLVPRREKVILFQNVLSLDNIIVFLDDGTLMITKIADKKYVGKNIIYANVWKKNDRHMIYNVAYLDGKTGYTFVKGFLLHQ